LKIVFLILAGGGPEHINDELTQRETWARSSQHLHHAIWIRSGDKLCYEEVGRTLFVPCKEKELLIKSLIAVDWVLKNIDFDVVVRTNVSTFFHLNRLENVLSSLRFNANSYGGYLQFKPKKTKNSFPIYFISGTGIFLGRESAKELCKMEQKEWQYVPDDIAISDFLASQVHLNITSIPRLTLSNHHFFLPHFFIRCKTSWNPSLASKRMRNLYVFFSTEVVYRKIIVFLSIYWAEVIYSRKSPKAIWNYSVRIWVEIKETILNKRVRNGKKFQKKN